MCEADAAATHRAAWAKTVASNRRVQVVVDRTLPTLPVTGCDRSNLVNAIFDSQRGRPTAHTSRTSGVPSRRKNLVLRYEG